MEAVNYAGGIDRSEFVCEVAHTRVDGVRTLTQPKAWSNEQAHHTNVLLGILATQPSKDHCL